MAVALADLTSWLEADVPARDGVPSSDQYERAAKDAVADYGRRRPVRRSYALSVVSGTSEYSLPEDFLFLIELVSEYDDSGVLNTPNGLIPLSASFDERVSVAGQTLTIWPEPAYTLERTLWYGAGHVLDDSDEYAYLADSDVEVLMLRARATALNMQANVAAQEAWTYGLGDETVDKRELVKQLRAQADGLMVEYRAVMSKSVGPVTLIG